MDWNLVVAIAGVGATVLFGTVAALQGRRRPAHTRTSTPAEVDAAALELAKLVEGQWRDEVGVRRLKEPSLTVRWKPADAELGGPGWLAGTPEWRTDHIGHLVGAFRREAKPRLIILGEPGAGKTTLAVLLTLELCHRSSNDDPVPVLLSPGSWSPASEHLHTWIKRRLAEDYPVLRATAIEGLVAGGRLLPVIDGLDELPDSSARRALEGIRQALAGRDTPLIVTCRTEEYRRLLITSEVIAGAAVIQAQDVDRGDVLAYLATYQEQYVSPARRPLWQPVLHELSVNRDGPLAKALSTPLMLSLVRTVYAEAPADPGELINLGRFPDQASIESHLLDELVPILIATTQPATRPETPRRPRPWNEQASQRWLSFLAAHLKQLDTRDLAWWELAPGGSRRRRARKLMLRVPGGLVTGLATGLATGLVAGLQVGRTAGLVVGVLLGLTSGYALRDDPAGAPESRLSHIVIRFDERFRDAMVLALFFGLMSALGVGFMFRLVLVAGLSAGLATWLAVGLELGLGRASHRPPTPRTSFNADRAATAMVIVTMAVALGLPAGLVFGLASELDHRLAAGLAAGLEVGLVLGLVFGVRGRQWPRYELFRAWFAIRSQLPWPLMTFLEDCRTLGILRQVGPVYQFRHARLQDHLAR